MADTFVLNQIPNTYGTAWFLLFNMLTGAGWVIKSSGDGVSNYSSSGSTFSGGGATGAHGFSNANAWLRLQDPGGGREITIQVDSTVYSARIKYSPSAKFTGGSPSYQQTPSATDEQILCGAGTDASPTMSGFFASTNIPSSGTKFQGGARSAAPYGFWFSAAGTPGGSSEVKFYMDPVQGVSADPDPVVWGLGTSWTSGSMTSDGFGFMDVAKTQWEQIQTATYNAGGFFADTGGALNPFTGFNDGLPILCYRTSTPNPGMKGWSTLFRWTSIARTNYLDTAANLTWITVGSVFTFWDGVTTPTN